MAIEFLVNHAWEDCAELLVTDVASTPTDMSGHLSITGGPHYLFWEQFADAERHIAYVNKNNTMGYDTVVMTAAGWHLTHSVAIGHWTTYPSAFTNDFSSGNFSFTGIGESLQDWVFKPGSAKLNHQGLGVKLLGGTGGAYQKRMYKFFFSRKFSFSEPPSQGLAIRPSYGETILVRNNNYHLRATAQITFDNVTRDEIEQFERLYHIHDEPLFVYDASGTWLYEKLWHCLVAPLQVVESWDDFHTVIVTLRQLRRFG